MLGADVNDGVGDGGILVAPAFCHRWGFDGDGVRQPVEVRHAHGKQLRFAARKPFCDGNRCALQRNSGAGRGKTHHDGALCIHIIASCIHQHMPGAGKWFRVPPAWTTVQLEKRGDSSKCEEMRRLFTARAEKTRTLRLKNVADRRKRIDQSAANRYNKQKP